VAGAPVLVVVCGDTGLGDRRVMEASVFPAIQNLLLAATALGLGSSLTTLPLVFGQELASIVALPEHVLPMAVIPLGWPARPFLGAHARLRSIRHQRRGEGRAI
jgi:nitroreductase